MKNAFWATAMIFGAASLPALGVSLSDGVDAPNLIWSTGGDGAWFAQTSESHDGADSAQSGAIGDSQETWVQTQVTGPGILTFWWKVSSESFDLLEFYVDSELQASISGEADWNRGFYPLPAGTHTVLWRYHKDSSGVDGQDAGWLDEVSFTPSVGLAEAVDISWLTFKAGGDIAWYGQTNVTHDGVNAAQSGPIGNSEISWMETTVTGPTTISFWWKVSSEAGFDFLEFYVSDSLKKHISGETGWLLETYSIPPGPQTLRWQYNKDQSDGAGLDMGWVDQVTSSTPPPFKLSSGKHQPDGSFLLGLSGLVNGNSYSVQTSSNLLQWAPLVQVTGTASQMSILDTTASRSPVRFYRVISP